MDVSVICVEDLCVRMSMLSSQLAEADSRSTAKSLVSDAYASILHGYLIQVSGRSGNTGTKR